MYSVAALLFGLAPLANASTYDFTFSGPAVSGTIDLTYGTATDATYSSAYALTGISGTFSDTTLGIVNAAITSLVPVNYATPEAGNLLTPTDFSRYFAGSTVLTFDNLFYPAGSPQTATSYPFHGGFVDIYGLLFGISNGDVVDFWSNGILPGSTSVDYGVAVANSTAELDYVGNGVIAPTPEPGTLCLLSTGMLAILFWRRPALLGARS